jgi:hypothetical protein
VIKIREQGLLVVDFALLPSVSRLILLIFSFRVFFTTFAVFLIIFGLKWLLFYLSLPSRSADSTLEDLFQLN